MLGLQTVEYKSFKGLYGTTQKVSPEEQYFASVKDYFTLNNDNELLVRPGFANLNTSGSLGVNAYFAFVFTTATYNQILFLRGGSGMDVWEPPGTVTNFNVLSHATAKWIIQYNNNAYVLGGTTIYQWDGAAETSLAGTPQIGFGVIHKERMFGCTRTATNPSRVYYSDSGDMTTWGGSSFFDVNPGDGQSVTGMASLGDRLIIFKDRSAYVLLAQEASPTNWVVTKINETVGCRSPHSIQVLNGLIYFASNRNIHRTDGLSFQAIGDPVLLRPSTNFLGPLPYNPNGGSTVGFWGGVWNNFYIVYLDWLDLNTPEVFLFDINTGVWWCWSLPGATGSPVPMGFFQEYKYNGVNGLFCYPIRGMSGSTPTVSYVAWLSMATTSSGPRFTYNELDCVGNAVSYPKPSFELKHLETDTSLGYKKLFRVGVSTSGYSGISGSITPIVDDSNMTAQACSYSSTGTLTKFHAPAVRYGNRFSIKYDITMTNVGSNSVLPVGVYGVHFDFSPARKLTKQST